MSATKSGGGVPVTSTVAIVSNAGSTSVITQQFATAITVIAATVTVCNVIR